MRSSRHVPIPYLAGEKSKQKRSRERALTWPRLGWRKISWRRMGVWRTQLSGAEEALRAVGNDRDAEYAAAIVVNVCPFDGAIDGAIGFKRARVSGPERLVGGIEIVSQRRLRSEAIKRAKRRAIGAEVVVDQYFISWRAAKIVARAGKARVPGSSAGVISADGEEFDVSAAAALVID